MSAIRGRKWVLWNHTGTNILTGITGAALNGTPTTNAIDVGEYNVVRPVVLFTRVAATSIILTPTISEDGTNYASYPIAGAFSSGNSAVSAGTYTWTTSTTGTYAFPALTLNDRYLKIALTGAASGATDLVSLQLYLAVA